MLSSALGRVYKDRNYKVLSSHVQKLTLYVKRDGCADKPRGRHGTVSDGSPRGRCSATRQNDAPLD